MNAKHRERIKSISGHPGISQEEYKALQYALQAIDFKEKVEEKIDGKTPDKMIKECEDMIGEGFPKEQKFVSPSKETITEEYKKILDRQYWNIQYYNQALADCRIPYLKVVQELERVKKLLKAGEGAGIHAIKRVFDLEKENEELKKMLRASIPKEGKCAYCPYIKVISFTPDSELARKVIDELRQEIKDLEARLNDWKHELAYFTKEDMPTPKGVAKFIKELMDKIPNLDVGKIEPVVYKLLCSMPTKFNINTVVRSFSKAIVAFVKSQQ